jgi:uncharacterized oligopeptide transporter (OPT) family protein
MPFASVGIRSASSVQNQRDVTGQTGFYITTIAASTVVIGAMLYFAVQLIPLLAQVVYQLVPMTVVVWFVVMALRGIIRGLLP